MLNETSISIEERAQMRRFLNDRFNMSELKNLAYDLGLNHDDLPYTNKPDLSRELLSYFERVGRLSCLVEELIRQRNANEFLPLLNRLDSCKPHTKVQIVLTNYRIDKPDLLNALAALLKIEPDEISLIATAPGSIKLLVSLPKDAAVRLLEMRPETIDGKYQVISIDSYENLPEKAQRKWQSSVLKQPSVWKIIKELIQLNILDPFTDVFRIEWILLIGLLIGLVVGIIFLGFRLPVERTLHILSQNNVLILIALLSAAGLIYYFSLRRSLALHPCTGRLYIVDINSVSQWQMDLDSYNRNRIFLKGKFPPSTRISKMKITCRSESDRNQGRIDIQIWIDNDKSPIVYTTMGPGSEVKIAMYNFWLIKDPNDEQLSRKRL